MVPSAAVPAAHPAALPSGGRAGSQFPASLLLPLDRLEEGLEVPLAEAQRAVPLDQLEEDGGPVADRLGEDLQQVPVLVAVDQDPTSLQLLDRHADLADA